jgi:hypothetical protein
VYLASIVSGKSDYGIDAQGFENAPVYDVSLTGCDFSNVAKDNIIKNVRGLTFRNVKINGQVLKAPF